ncbi:MAG: hypothetical protein M1834_001884 [Cirrosporium novae-zelandiae]|nr:MAG: hypothetical protein M1834_001884 [Cirrosporium novae-zelandiae]
MTSPNVELPRMNPELTYLSREWEERIDPEYYSVWMASSEVDQKYLGRFAKSTSEVNPFLSAMLYKVLGLSVILSKKLLRARQKRRLDTLRDTKSLQLYHHIIWLSREGLILVEQYVLPMVTEYVELRVLAYKLQASFYHIFVLFHNQPTIHHAKFSSSTASSTSPTKPETPFLDGGGKPYDRGSIRATPPLSFPQGGPVGGSAPPGLSPISPTKPAASFLLPAKDYIPTTTQCFKAAVELSEALLPGSHPIRLSVKLEYAAFMYDCLHEGPSSRRLAKQAIADVYNAPEGMDDDTFEDAAELVGTLAKMMKRGLNGSTSRSTLGPGSESGESRGKTSTGKVLEPAIPSIGMENPI